jgi:Tfp pilus assembly protein FimT
MNEDIVFITGFFFTTIVLAIAVPLLRAHIRRKDAETKQMSPISDAKLARIEAAIESMAIEVERISEGQRFVTKLLAEREAVKSLPQNESR